MAIVKISTPPFQKKCLPSSPFRIKGVCQWLAFSIVVLFTILQTSKGNEKEG